MPAPVTNVYLYAGELFFKPVNFANILWKTAHLKLHNNQQIYPLGSTIVVTILFVLELIEAVEVLSFVLSLFCFLICSCYEDKAEISLPSLIHPRTNACIKPRHIFIPL